MKSVYEMVTDRIIEQLEKGIIPWQKPWNDVTDYAYNRVSKKEYSFLNQMLLSKKGEYATFKQWNAAGGRIKKGAKSEIVVFWKMLPVKEKQKDGTEKEKLIPLLKYISVFHISQVDGVEPVKRDELYENDALETPEKILHDYWERENITIRQEKCDKACYMPSRDIICLPLFEQFKDPAEYYSTAFHESVHSTMHEARCNRMEERKGHPVLFGSETYSKEELVAEIGSADLMNITGTETKGTFCNSSAYIKNWLQVLKNDPKFIVSASGKAEKAVKYILGNC